MLIRKVLLVDDDAAIRKVAEITLRKIGKWEVLVAESGAMALTLLNEFRPDVILMDMMMPGMDGLTTFNTIRQNPMLAGIPVIFMTAKVHKHEVEGYFEEGATGVISKPFDPMSLPQEIQAICQAAVAVCVA